MQSKQHALSMVKIILSRKTIIIRKRTHIKQGVEKSETPKFENILTCPICKQAWSTHPCGSACHPIYYYYPTPDVRWSNYPLPPPPMPSISSPPPPHLPTHHQVCMASQTVGVHAETCIPLPTTQQFEPNTFCGDNTSTNRKPPTSKVCYHSNFEYRTAINSAPNHPVREHYQDVSPLFSDTLDVIPSVTPEPSRGVRPPRRQSQEPICSLMKTNRMECLKTTRRPFTIPGLPKNYVHPKPKDYNFPPPFISPDGASVLKFLKLKTDIDLDAYIENLCQLATVEAHSFSSGDCARPASRKNKREVTPIEQICSFSPTVQFVSELESGTQSPQTNICGISVTRRTLSSISDICKHTTHTTSPLQEDLRKTMSERKTTNESISKPHVRLNHKGATQSKQSLQEYCRKNTKISPGKSCKLDLQPWISQYGKPKYQTNTSMDNICRNIKKPEVLVSYRSLKPEHAKPSCVPEHPKSQEPCKDCIKVQYLSKPILEFSSKSPRPIKIKPVCPDPPERYPPIKSSYPRYSPSPTSNDICQSISRSTLQCSPDCATLLPRNYKLPAVNSGIINMRTNKPLKLCNGPKEETCRRHMCSDSQTCLNYIKQIDEPEESNTRSPRDPCCPEELGHNQIPYNPCCPTYHKGNHRKFKMFFMLLGFPIILIQMLRIYACGGFSPHHKDMPCCEYEYMRRRTKRFPWGDGNESLFHNSVVNHLPADCDADCKKRKDETCKKNKNKFTR